MNNTNRTNTLRRVFQQTFDPDGTVTTKTRLETMREREEREKREKDQQAEDKTMKTMSIKAHNMHELLNTLIDELYEAGVDVSYFPHSARLVLIKYAKKMTTLL